VNSNVLEKKEDKFDIPADDEGDYFFKTLVIIIIANMIMKIMT